MAIEARITPMMAQWHACKTQAEDAILLFRLGDFYEAFYDDAKLISSLLDLTLTKRQEIPMAGIPYHASENYIDQLVAKGYKVAIAEQTEDSKQAKGLVKREIVRRITPGTCLGIVTEKQNNYFVSLYQTGQIYGLGVIDLTTGEFKTTEFETLPPLLSEICLLRPKEILTTKKLRAKIPFFFDELAKSFHPLITEKEEWLFAHDLTYPFLTAHFKVHNLDGFGLKGMTGAINASGAILCYLKDHLTQSIDHVRSLTPYFASEFLLLDRITQRNLELTESIWDQSRNNTLLEVLDHTVTPMGGRLMKQWIKQPLYSVPKIINRQDAIEVFFNLGTKLNSLDTLLARVKDLERLTMRVSTNQASPKDILALRLSLEPIVEIKQFLKPLTTQSSLLEILEEQLNPLQSLIELLQKALVDEPPFRVSDGGIFREGYHQELDEIRHAGKGNQNWMANYQSHLKETTGIKTLKVGFTKISGFYIEVSRGQAEKVPGFFERRQTLTNAERYITAELKSHEEKVLSAEEKSLRLEQELFKTLKEKIVPYFETILTNAQAIGHLDCLKGLALTALKHDYIRPEVNEGYDLNIFEGRHPVIEAKGKEAFIPNDTHLQQDKERLMLITGPNMAGKSTYIRQTALLVIMAQMGSFIPAKEAKIGLIDKVFTRIGASDDLTRGQSTFMVEMTETANILHNATPRSLVILDEIGRGTSTYDGISLAWSIAEYLLTQEGRQAKTLFATHFWELTKLEDNIPGALNYTVAVHENEDEILFLRKIVRGGTDKSYGIHVAKLAGLPIEVLHRSYEILAHLEENSNRKSAFEPKPKKPKLKPASDAQLTLF